MIEEKTREKKTNNHNRIPWKKIVCFHRSPMTMTTTSTFTTQYRISIRLTSKPTQWTISIALRRAIHLQWTLYGVAAAAAKAEKVSRRSVIQMKIAGNNIGTGIFLIKIAFHLLFFVLFRINYSTRHIQLLTHSLIVLAFFFSVF